MRRYPFKIAAAVLTLSGLACGPAVKLGPRWRDTPSADFYTSNVVKKYACTACHTIGDRGGTVGPVLNNVGYRRDEQWLRKWLKEPNDVKNGTPMPQFPLTEDELDEAVGLLSKMKLDHETDEILGGAGSDEDKGGKLFEDFDCYACHRIGDRGRFVGPNLTWLGKRKSREWEANWLKDPPAFKPETFMPNFKLRPKAIEALTAYLHSLQGQDNGVARDWERRSSTFFDFTKHEQGKLVFDRMACWTCHGPRLRDGQPNRNAAPEEKVPDVFDRVADLDAAALKALVEGGKASAKLDPNGPEPWYGCPDYSGALDDEEVGNLLIYLKSMAPKQSKWKFKL